MATNGSIDRNPDEDGNVWNLNQKLDQPMDEEARRLRNMYKEKKFSAIMVLQLAFQSLGVVYGDLGTSPLYVFYNTFPDGVEDPEDLVGALSLIIYSLTLIPLLKYVLIVCRANDNGQGKLFSTHEVALSEGGTFAIYSLLCRHAKLRTIPNEDRTDEELTTYSRSIFSEHSFAAKTKRWLERHAFMKNSMLILVLVGSCMVIGDGILTPAISEFINIVQDHKIFLRLYLVVDQRSPEALRGILSAVGGINVGQSRISNDVVVLVAVLILAVLFSIQHYGIDKVGWLFAPIVLLWFLLIGGIGIYNIWKYDSGVLRAFSPVYIYRYFRRGKREGWTSLGGIMLSITGTEALFADLSHFPVLSIQIAFTVVVFPCLLLAYSGQAAYLMKHSHNIVGAFYHSIPGTAVVIVMLVTTFLMILVMILVWRCHWILVLLFTVLSLVVEGTYFSAVVLKVNQGGWVPLVISAVFFAIMYIWHYGTLKRYEIEMHSKVSMAWILGLGPSLGLVRVPGVGLVYTELANGVPRIFSHFITNLPAIHSVVVFVCIKYLPVYTVPEDERFLIKRIGPEEFHMFRCVARYGYKDLHKKDYDFEKNLFDTLTTFVRLDCLMNASSSATDEYSLPDQEEKQTSDSRFNSNGNTTLSIVDSSISSVDVIVQVRSPLHANRNTQSSGHTEIDELQFLNNCRDTGVVHILGNTVIRARRDSNFCKKIAVDYIYAFLKKICRENSSMLNVPHESLLNVGQVFYV
ncbi:hypothetical protein TIFTF001_033105 [Ficus carica]|uniref:Potassium transporter n=1 Tax=Ficus carica TaxID=3494 RepID=A0AA88DXV2_FICCA|nr:hypothetical protein TIFTF001_033105 [Ficus carica]